MNSIRKARGAAPCRSRRVHRRFGEIRGSGPPTAPSRSRLGFARRVLAVNTEPRPQGSGRLERVLPKSVTHPFELSGGGAAPYPVSVTSRLLLVAVALPGLAAELAVPSP